MLLTLFQMFALIGLGLMWAWFKPGGMDNAIVRKVLTDVVYYVFLPALVFNVLLQADLGIQSVKIALSASIGVIVAWILSWSVCKRCKSNRAVTGAIILAASFPNATYLGYPVLVNTLGDWAGPVALQYDLFACTPLLLTVGILMAARFGNSDQQPHPVLLLLKVPPLWAALIATLLNLLGIKPYDGFTGLLSMMASVVVPIMLFSIGLALRQGFHEIRHLKTIAPVIIIQLLIMPLIVLGSSQLLSMPADLTTAVVLEAAMPSMALGVVLCDRYGLNTGIYAAAVTATTLLSLFSLPWWLSVLA